MFNEHSDEIGEIDDFIIGRDKILLKGGRPRRSCASFPGSTIGPGRLAKLITVKARIAARSECTERCPAPGGREHEIQRCPKHPGEVYEHEI